MRNYGRYTEDGYQVSLTEDDERYTLDVTDMRGQHTVHSEVFNDQEEANCAYYNWDSGALPNGLLCFNDPMVYRPSLDEGLTGDSVKVLFVHKRNKDYCLGTFCNYDYEDAESWGIYLEGPDGYKLDKEAYLWSYLPDPKQFIKEL